VPTYDPDEIFDLATRRDEVDTLLDWYNALTNTIDAGVEIVDVLEDVAMGGIDQITDVGLIATTGGQALTSFLNHILLQQILKHLAGGNWWNPAPGDSIMEALRGDVTPLIDTEKEAGNERNLLDDTKALYNFFHGIEE
jgi:hypothetical protein